MKKNAKFTGIKNILSRDEMKQIKGGCCVVVCLDLTYYQTSDCCGYTQSVVCSNHGGMRTNPPCTCS